MPARLALVTATALALAAACPAALGQSERRELGHRLHAFEQSYDKATAAEQAAARKAVGPASLRFLALRFADAATAIDAGRAALTSPTPLERLAMSLAVDQDARLVETGSVSKITLTLRALYGAPNPQGVRVRVRTPFGTGERLEWDLGRLPTAIEVPVAAFEGDFFFEIELRTAGVPGPVVLWQTVCLAQVTGLAARLKALEESARALPRGLERSTMTEYATRFRALAANEPAESGEDAVELLRQFESLAESLKAGSTDLGRDRPIGFALGVPYGRAGEAVVRVRAPAQEPPPAGWPVLVLLHGAGGSENLFFEGYGAGCMVKGGAKLGSFVVAPRAGLFGPPPVREVLAELAKRYPLDLGRVDLVGHSLGVAHALSIAQKPGFAVRRMALLAGTGQVSRPERLAEIATFVGVGSDDFAREGALALGDELARHLPAGRLTRKLYDGGEHLTIVRQACDDVLAFLAAPGPK